MAGYVVRRAENDGYSEQPNVLYTAINSLPKNAVEEIYKEYGDPDRDFKPVNLLRTEIARRLLQGESASETLVNEIKEKIRTKDVDYFRHYRGGFLKQLQEYELFKRDLFANWQKSWNVFHVFFYRGIIKETVLNYLEQISIDLLTKLDLKDYNYHKVDFQGATNFGSDFSWLALYPITKESHKDSYQFFLRLSDKPDVGRMAGHSIKKPKPDQLKEVNSYDEALKYLESIKPELVKLNKESRNYFKFAPGSQASEWQRFYIENVIAIDFHFGDLTKFSSREELSLSIGLPDDSKSNKTFNLWLFKTANIGDVVFATKGVNTCIGIGIILGNYSYDKNADDFNHRRTVKWITDKVYQYKADTLQSYKTLFRPDTFSPTKAYEFILNEYIRMYPELGSVFAENNLKFDAENIGAPSVAENDGEFEIVTEEVMSR
jgi:5-methylcytosine-specific restriction protein B